MKMKDIKEFDFSKKVDFKYSLPLPDYIKPTQRLADEIVKYISNKINGNKSV